MVHLQMGYTTRPQPVTHALSARSLRKPTSVDGKVRYPILRRSWAAEPVVPERPSLLAEYLLALCS